MFGTAVLNLAKNPSLQFIRRVGTMSKRAQNTMSLSDSRGTKDTCKEVTGPISKKAKGGVCLHGPTNTYYVSSPLGDIIVVACPKGLHCVTQESNLTDADFKPDLTREVKMVRKLYGDNEYTPALQCVDNEYTPALQCVDNEYTPALQCVGWLEDFFNKRKNKHAVPALCPSIAPEGKFTTYVRKTLIEVAPFGTTISYQELSEAAGNSKAARAVGQAMANNPFMLVVPCHRVIRSDKSLGNYAGGRRNSVKEWLVDFEKDGERKEKNAKREKEAEM